MRKKIIKYPKERAVLSDILPFEVPLTFSNRYFFHFLVKNGIGLKDRKIIYNNNYSGDDRIAYETILTILFFRNLSDGSEWKFRKIPFIYKITHKEKDFRELAIIHPINQINLIHFYDKFKELIIYNCSISNYSLRKPYKIARFSYFNDQVHQSVKNENSDFLALRGKEYENLRTFFAYKNYTNIHQFYEDYRYQRAEKKYNSLYKFDISKCFDSIYTHSIAWATLGLECVKENIDSSKKTFAGQFDCFIQYANYGETNGILIGPEFSRIFAEIILQRIDRTVEEKLKSENIVLKRQYELYRYVDDYFLFYDEDPLKEKIVQIFKHELKKYKLSINNSKSKEYSKPIITEITIAKQKILQLFTGEQNASHNLFRERDDFVKDTSLFIQEMSLSLDSNKLITKYKTIIKESSVDYKDVLNYSLEILNNKVDKKLSTFDLTFDKILYLADIKPLTIKEDTLKIQLEEKVTSYIEGVLDFAFFIYSVSPRVNTTIKVCHILSKITKFFKQIKNIQGKRIPKYSSNNRERVFKKILDESSFILKKNSLNEYSQVDSLYLLVAIKDLGKEYRLPEQLLLKFFNLVDESGTINLKLGSLNYFTITVALFYIGNSTKYQDFKNAIQDYILEYIKMCPFERRQKSTEIIMLTLDLLFCPFLDLKFKKKVLLCFRENTKYSDIVKTIGEVNKIVAFKKHQKFFFTKWEKFNFAKELQTKKSQEVYS